MREERRGLRREGLGEGLWVQSNVWYFCQIEGAAAQPTERVWLERAAEESL